jgi:hypothetical protein
MTCQEFRDRVTVQLADGSESPGDHGESCADCRRYAEQARAVWEAAGRVPEEPVPRGVSEDFLRSLRDPRRSAPSLRLPAGLAAAAFLVLGGLLVVLPESGGPEPRQMMEGDGMLVERYDLRDGASPSAVAEDLRRTVSPESWAEGIGGLEQGEGFLRVRGPSDLQRQVRDFLRRYLK